MVREYTRVTDETRRRLINHIKAGRTIKEAAELVNINYENAKAINRIYKHETRVDKKKSRFRYRPGEDKAATKRKRIEFQRQINGPVPNITDSEALEDSESLYSSSEMVNPESNSVAERTQSNVVPSTHAVAEQLSIKTKNYLELIIKPRPLNLDPIKYDAKFFTLIQQDPVLALKRAGKANYKKSTNIKRQAASDEE